MDTVRAALANLPPTGTRSTCQPGKTQTKQRLTASSACPCPVPNNKHSGDMPSVPHLNFCTSTIRFQESSQEAIIEMLVRHATSRQTPHQFTVACGGPTACARHSRLPIVQTRIKASTNGFDQGASVNATGRCSSRWQLFAWRRNQRMCLWLQINGN